jgi:predicted regulator of Ras-like GTPase activity (Roadblock/LC7/MglB family)
VILDEAEALLDPVSDIEGFVLACLVDASTGMFLASRKDQDDISLPTAAARAADIANVLSQLTGELPVDGLEDVMVTFRGQLYMIRLVSPEPQILLLVILDRDRVNLAMARREIRSFCASFAA